MPAPEHFLLTPDEGIPNHPHWPVLLYRAALPAAATLMEERIGANGWDCRWRNGIFDYHHFHSTAHETLGIARGAARVMLGGPHGREVALQAGDVVVLPAGTGHCRVSASPDFLVIGAYPPGQDYEIERPGAVDLAQLITRIRAVEAPDSDPVSGPDGALMRLWSRR